MLAGATSPAGCTRWYAAQAHSRRAHSRRSRRLADHDPDGGARGCDGRNAGRGRALHRTRLWVIDIKTGRILFEELVAHGRASGDNLTNHFSNEPGSLASSLGLFLTGETYVGSNG